MLHGQSDKEVVDGIEGTAQFFESDTGRIPVRDWLLELSDEDRKAIGDDIRTAFQLASVMEEKGITKVEMAKQLETSRSQLDRLLDPENDKVTLATLSRAAKVVGRELTLELR